MLHISQHLSWCCKHELVQTYEINYPPLFFLVVNKNNIYNCKRQHIESLLLKTSYFYWSWRFIYMSNQGSGLKMNYLFERDSWDGVIEFWQWLFFLHVILLWPICKHLIYLLNFHFLLNLVTSMIKPCVSFDVEYFVSLFFSSITFLFKTLSLLGYFLLFLDSLPLFGS